MKATSRLERDAFEKGKGTPHQLMLESAIIIKMIYQQLKNRSLEDANEYKSKMQMMLLEPSTPIWKED